MPEVLTAPSVMTGDETVADGAVVVGDRTVDWAGPAAALPAGYAALAANEAEKRADIRVLEMVTFGAVGRVWLGGSEEQIQQAAAAGTHPRSPAADPACIEKPIPSTWVSA